MRRLFLLLSVGIITSGFAQYSYSCGEPNDCRCNNGCYRSCEAPCSCTYFSLSADFLYWYARETNLAFAVKKQMVTASNPQQSENPTIYNLAPSKYEYLSAKWKPGVRVGIGVISECGNSAWDLYARWTYYENHVKEKATVAPFPAILPDLNSFALTNPWLNGSVSTAPFFPMIQAKWKFRMNLADFELGKNLSLGNCFALRPFCGARLAWTETDFDLISSSANVQNLFVNPFVTTTTLYQDEFENCFWGAGITAGLQPVWSLASCFEIFSSVDVSLLWGQFKYKKDENYFDQSMSIPGGILTDQTKFLAQGKNSFHSMQAILDLAIGLRFKMGCCDNHYFFALDAGWEHHIWFSHNNRFQEIGRQDFTLISPNLTARTNIIDEETSHDIVFGGGVVRVRIEY